MTYVEGCQTHVTRFHIVVTPSYMNSCAYFTCCYYLTILKGIKFRIIYIPFPRTTANLINSYREIIILL